MNELIWDKTLSVEIDEIDEDHRKLVNLFNILTKAVADGASSEYLEAVLEELISCTVWHFRHEERLMLLHSYDDLEEHRTEHNELIDAARELQQKFLLGGRKVSGDDLEFLEQWLTQHILVADMALGAYLSGEM